MYKKYKIGSVIGEGAFASVRKGKNRETGERIAVKIMHKHKMTKEDLVGVRNEIRILSDADHPNIVKLLDTFENEKSYCLVLELMQGGELYDSLISQENLSEKEVHSLMVPIFDAVIYCHSFGIAHRDIKPENLLMTEKDSTKAILKISDFGFARLINNGLATSDVGTPSCVAPEILE